MCKLWLNTHKLCILSPLGFTQFVGDLPELTQFVSDSPIDKIHKK